LVQKSDDNRWTKQGISELWFVDRFLPTIGPDRPYVLIMDGHDSHDHVEFIKIARKVKTAHQDKSLHAALLKSSFLVIV
jgi:hypothetical protein